MNDKKSLMTNLISIILITLGYLLPKYGDMVKIIGFFAFSGAITNWLAIYMLFERVPFLYGSGIIPLQFETFKLSIKKMMLEQFFNENNLERFFNSEIVTGNANAMVDEVVQSIDYEKIYEGLIAEILNTSIGRMLNMFGGAKALQSLKEPCMNKLKLMVDEIAKNEILPKLINDKSIIPVKNKIEEMIDARLQELTPNQVKKLVKDMIEKYLGWVVIWGGVFGGLIGFLMEIAFKIK
ncbi:MAG: hypothetical protein JWM09_1339 [Francisellaceae bacterium]|nr:hypothetical protein [Francisellaceae bacterium]